MNNNIVIRNIEPQQIEINESSTILGVTNVYVNGVDVTIGTKAYVIVPTKTSELTNDSGFITSETDPTVPSYVKAISLSDINSWNSKQDQLVSGSNIKTINNNSLLGSGNINITSDYEAGNGISINNNIISNTITSYYDLENLPTIPTKTSELSNDSGFVNENTNSLTNYISTDLLKQILPSTSDSGTSLTLNDSVPYNIDTDILPSEIQQIRTTGKNLLPNTATTTTINGITFTANVDGTILVSGTASATAYLTYPTFSLNAGTYTLSAGVYVNTLTRIQLVEDTSGRLLLASTQNASSQTFTTTATKNVFLQFRINSGEVINTTFKPQLETGSTATSYEPYTGGKPSPSIAYPQEIYATRGNNQINICGKNLLDESTTIIGRAWNNATNSARAVVYTKVQPSTTYTLSVQDISNVDVVNYFEKVNDTDTTTIEGIVQLTTTRTITTSSTTNYIGVQINKTDISLSDIEGIELQIEKGSTATAYEPYQSQEYTINLNNFATVLNRPYLRVISDKDYYDRIFINKEGDPDYSDSRTINHVYIKSSFLFQTLVPEYNWTDAGVIEEGTHTYKIDKYYSVLRLANQDLIYSKYFSKDGKDKVYASGTTLYVQIDDSNNINSLDEFKTWLSNNEVNILGPTSEPLYNDYNSTIFGTAYRNLSENITSYSGTTNISQINDELPLQITASTFKKID